ncbi:ATP-grasp domain-containing protein [Streptomyces sp. NBC_00536]|uniref:ATP-grasp domain-containing protein n=1 Tax=Streptomyces sp. NBC_00536 TaxID=2975769 RepID=UPI002E824007|nr:ATP-grasp domain-containing protein [Streptomyces sp. NBC_00536]WUC83273.1 ATP-grasp domain-containing protein [Streptomyces sp. NBC_00536]
MIVVTYAAGGSASPTEAARACAPFGGAVFVLGPSGPLDERTRTVLESVGRVVVADDPADVVRSLAGTATAIDGVVAFADATVEVAAGLAEALGLPYHSPRTAARLRDKLAQRRRLNEAGVGFVPVVWSGTGAGLTPFDRGAYPVVVKPRRGAGSEECVIIEGPEDHRATAALLDPAREYLAEGYIPDGAPPDEHLANFLSVESAVRGGDVVHLGISGRLPLAPPVRESGTVFPAPLSPETAGRVTALADRAIRALGITCGVVHTEIKLAPRGPQIIEVNGRLGGYLSELMKLVGHADPVGLAAQLAAGGPLPQPRSARGAALVVLRQPPMEARTVLRVPTSRDLVSLPGVVRAKQWARAGAPLDWRVGTAGMVLQVWMHGTDWAGLRRDYLRVTDFLDRNLRYAYVNDTDEQATPTSSGRAVPVKGPGDERRAGPVRFGDV